MCSRSKRSRGNVQTLSAITAALKEEEEEEEESDEEQQQPLDDDSDIDDIDNPRWQLFETVKTQTSSGGHVLSEHFWRLPNRRYYRDYYKEIKNPVSLLQIKNKLKKGEYGTVSEVAGDLNIMFENAKKYNRPESRLFKVIFCLLILTVFVLLSHGIVSPSTYLLHSLFFNYLFGCTNSSNIVDTIFLSV